MWDKLKHEWKTFAWGIVGTLLEVWDQVLVGVLPELGNIVPPQYQWIVHVVVPTGFLLLRRWKDQVKDAE